MQPLLQAAVIPAGAGLTTVWWLAIRTHTAGEALRIATLFILVGAVAITLYEYLAWKRRLNGSARRLVRQRDLTAAIRTVSLAAVTPLLEKNASKTLTTDAPMIFSMSRLVVLAFATLSIAVVLALPILGALERATPEQVVDVTRTLIGRLGVGEITLGKREAESVS